MSKSQATQRPYGLGDGQIVNPIALHRTLAPVGSTQSAQWTWVDPFLTEVQKLCELLKPEGPTNFQFLLRDGLPFLLEINPRFSSSTSIRVLCGVNEAEMCLEYYLSTSSTCPPEERLYKLNQELRTKTARAPARC